MSPQKLALIQMAAKKSDGKSGRELSHVMMALITGAKKQGIHFTSDEITCILSVIKEGKTKKEQAEIDHMIDFARSFMQKM